jgi:hypothetical protein
MRIFFLAGEQESETLVQNIDNMIDVLSDAGFGPDEMRFDTHADGQHSEWFWAREFPVAFEWLFMSAPVSTTSTLSQDVMRIYPNPALDSISLEWPGENTPNTLYIFDSSGREVGRSSYRGGMFDVSSLAKGVYHLRLEFDNYFLGQNFVKR